MYQVDCEEPVATGLPLLLPEVALPAHWTASCGYESLHIWSLGPAPCACSIAVRLELNSVVSLIFLPKVLLLVHWRARGWAGLGLGGDLCADLLSLDSSGRKTPSWDGCPLWDGHPPWDGLCFV